MNGPQIHTFGNLTRDPEQRFTQADGTKYVRLRIAANTYHGEDREAETHFFDVNLFRYHADRAMARCRRGTEVYVSGQFSHSEYDRNDGTKGFSMLITGKEFRPISRTGPAEIGPVQPEEDTPVVAPDPEDPDEFIEEYQ